MTVSALSRVHEVLERFRAKDIEGVVELFAPDGVLYDPHYPPPVGPAMAGRDAIREGLSWGLAMLEQPGFDVRNELSNPDIPNLAAVEVDTNHRMVGGASIAFPQMFVAELGDGGLLRRVQSYTPYPPPAMP